MPFAFATRDRIFNALELPTSIYYLERVQQALDHVDLWGGIDAVTRIEGYLTRYEGFELLLNQEVCSGDLIRADELEWSKGGKTLGIKSEMLRYRRLISKSLLLEALVKGDSIKLVRLQ